MATRDRTDEAITIDVVDSLFWDSRVDASKVAVTVDKGVVTLAGTVSPSSARAAAEEDTWVISGVHDAEDQHKVDRREAVPADRAIKAHIERTFTADSDLYPFDLNVRGEQGWVTLEGTVDAFWKKVRAEDLASGMRGVIEVTNKVAVVLTEVPADKILAETILHALDRNIYVNVDDIDVTVENGTVILTGAVPTRAAKRAAHDVARFTLGVREVKDRIPVRVPEETPQS